MKKILLVFYLMTFIFSCFLPVSVFATNSNESIQVLLNDRKINFDVEPIILSGRTLVPLRAIFEELGAKVDWIDNTKTVMAEQGKSKIVIKVGDKFAYLNKKKIDLDVPAVIIDGRTLVPIRFISESLGYDVSWKESVRTVVIEKKSSATTPTSLPAPTSLSTPTLTNSQTSSKSAQYSYNKSIDRLMGLSISEVISIFGQPNRVDLSKYGFDWYIYNSDYSKYIQIGVHEGYVVGIYTNSTNYKVWETIGVFSEKDAVKSMLGTPLTYIKKGNTRYIINNNGDQEVFDFEGEYYATIFYDKQNGSKVSAVRLIASEVERSLNGYYGISSDKLRESYERQVFDLANSVRSIQGKKPFKWDDKAAQTARKHSEDMALNNYFSHTSLLGKSPFDRMKDDGIKFYRAAENIAMGQSCGIDAHEIWMNSPGHKSNILGDCEKLGVGVYIGSGNRILYTQNFYTD